jgi:hypothetical protein
MSEIEPVREPQRLFKFAIDSHIAQDKSERLHFFRMNRWRYNTFNRFNCKSLITQSSKLSNSKAP